VNAVALAVRIESRIARADYDYVEGVGITRLKELRRSPQHYQWALTHPKKSGALTLGIAAHIAVLEPHRFAEEFAIWTRATDAGAMAPRRGQYWDTFCAEHPGCTVLTPKEGGLCQQIAAAVRNDPLAMKYLGAGDPEVTLLWGIAGRQCKGRADWLTTIDGKPYIVGLKTARDCRPFVFGSQCAKLGYHLQFAFYADGYEAITGKRPSLIEIVVESAPPHATAVYRVTEDVLAQGRDEYLRLLDILTECEITGDWPGPVPREEDLTLPTWAYDASADDISELGLELTQ
jgi:exodeoxyribonuclease VIII